MAQLAARQHGVVARRQLGALGLTPRQVDRLVGRGWLRPVHRGVYTLVATPLSGRGRASAALLTQRRRAVLSHLSAAALWDLRAWPRVIELTVDTSAGGAQRPGIRVHRARLPREEVAQHQGLAVTSPSRTLLDLAAVLDSAALDRAAGEAERRRLFDLNAIGAVLARHPGRRGSRPLRALLARGWVDLEHTRSELERLFLELCRRHGIEIPLVNTVVEGYTVDFLWSRHRLIAETDGARTHFTRRAFEADPVRDADLTAAGYRVVRFTYARVTERPAEVAAVLRRLLAAGSAVRPPRSGSGFRS